MSVILRKTNALWNLIRFLLFRNQLNFWTWSKWAISYRLESVRSKTSNKKEWLLLMFLLSSFMTSIYSIISIETRLVTHFSGYEIITLHYKGMLYVSNHDFLLLAYWNITKFPGSIHFPLVTLICQLKFQQLFILFVLRKKD